MDGAVELVRDLNNAGIPVAVASSAPIETIKGNMIRFGIEQYIDHFVSGTECVRGKPDPEIYLKAASLLKADPADCIAVEDSASGVSAVKATGMYCIGFVPPKAVPQDISIADEIITLLYDIISITESRLL